MTPPDSRTSLSLSFPLFTPLHYLPNRKVYSSRFRKASDVSSQAPIATSPPLATVPLDENRPHPASLSQHPDQRLTCLSSIQFLCLGAPPTTRHSCKVDFKENSTGIHSQDGVLHFPPAAYTTTTTIITLRQHHHTTASQVGGTGISYFSSPHHRRFGA